MLHYIKGKLIMRIEGGVVVETGGIGFEINVPDNISPIKISCSSSSSFVLYSATGSQEFRGGLYLGDGRTTR